METRQTTAAMKFDMQALQALRMEEGKDPSVTERIRDAVFDSDPSVLRALRGENVLNDAPITQIIDPQREYNKLQSALLHEAYRNENLGTPSTDGELDRGQ